MYYSGTKEKNLPEHESVVGERVDVMNTCVTRNTKVGNSIPVAKKTDHMMQKFVY